MCAILAVFGLIVTDYSLFALKRLTNLKKPMAPFPLTHVSFLTRHDVPMP